MVSTQGHCLFVCWYGRVCNALSRGGQHKANTQGIACIALNATQRQEWVLSTP